MAAKINDTSHMQNLCMVGLKNINKSMGGGIFSCFDSKRGNKIIRHRRSS